MDELIWNCTGLGLGVILVLLSLADKEYYGKLPVLQVIIGAAMVILASSALWEIYEAVSK